MGYEWLSIEDGVVTVGLTEDAITDLSDDVTLNLPEQDDSVSGGKICGDIESNNGTLNLYSPVSGTIIEVNEAVLENPDLLQEDPTDEGWLFKIEADDPEKLDRLSIRATNHDDDDKDDDDDSDDGDEDDDTDDDE
ncbi:MAG: hypothetical protein A2Z20_04350 [Bdellovibrionales bacterium RBG_16_40_8]|nr:MAG: hypothetical protein A2Z20_04350 [Bdellovibrionales bacterium RBG_16_40_8]